MQGGGDDINTYLKAPALSPKMVICYQGREREKRGREGEKETNKKKKRKGKEKG